MGSETERREAAAGLRELAAAPKQDWFRLAEALFGDRFRTRREIVGRLADLVEPAPERTCRMVDNMTREFDPVERPAHYSLGGIEAKDALASAMSGASEAYMGRGGDGVPAYRALSGMDYYWWGCAFKYLWRWPRKNGIEDLRKCRQCIDLLLEEMGEGE